MKKFLALSLAVLMLVSLLTACGGAASSAPASTPASGASSTAGAEDTITVLVPPVTNDYLEKMTEWAAEFHEMYPNLTMEVIGTSWDDHNTKLSTMANAGEAPDIAEMSYAAIGTYVENGTALNLSEVMDPTLLADFDQNALDYMTIAGNVYGLPLYIHPGAGRQQGYARRCRRGRCQGAVQRLDLRGIHGRHQGGHHQGLLWVRVRQLRRDRV